MNQKTIRILCIGNSHTAGFPQYDPAFGGNPKSSYEYWLKNTLSEKLPEFKFELENHGVCGELTSDILYRLRSIENLKRFDIVLFWGGANDLGLGRSINSIWNNLEQAYLYATQYNVKFFYLTIPPMNIPGMNEPIVTLNQLILEKPTDDVIDIYSTLVVGNRLNQDYGIGDGVHLSIRGYQAVADSISPILIDFIEK